MRQEQMTVIEHRSIADNIYELTLQGEMVTQMLPGQFVHIRVHRGTDPLLRRPISICRIDKERKQFTMIYRAEGPGTTKLSSKTLDETVDVLGPLGNGFPVHEAQAGETALLVGGGIGVPPLYELSLQLKQRGVNVIHVLGFQTKSAVFYEAEFAELGDTYIATADGTYGRTGFVTDVIEQRNLQFDVLYSCGPTPMLRALEVNYPHKRGFLSLEQRMGCGIGACFACVCHTKGTEKTDYRKICSDGPVFSFGEVVL